MTSGWAVGNTAPQSRYAGTVNGVINPATISSSPVAGAGVVIILAGDVVTPAVRFALGLDNPGATPSGGTPLFAPATLPAPGESHALAIDSTGSVQLAVTQTTPGV